MHNTLQAANNAAHFQSIGAMITDALRRFIVDEIAIAINRRPTETISREETAALLKISLPTLLKRTADGTIPCVRVGRRVLFQRAQIEALLGGNNG
jgi:excisionase family DNA binding protein